MDCGLIGRKLGHSFSPKIHSLLGNYPTSSGSRGMSR